MWQELDNSLYKKFEFSTFDEAIKFINDVASLSKAANHHPKIINSYSIVEIFLSTHSAGDKITDKDRSMVEKIDNLISDNKEESTDVKSVKLYTDGGSRGNPGPSATGFVILDFKDQIVNKGSKYLGITTNNQAEYTALVDGLKKCQDIGVEELEVYMDSLLIINQMKGSFKVKNADLIPLYRSAIQLSHNFKSISYTHVRRELNSIADSLVNECLDSQ